MSHLINPTLQRGVGVLALQRHFADGKRLFVVSSGISWDFGGHKRCNGNTTQVDNPRDRLASL